MKTVILYGELAKRFGREHRFDIQNGAGAIRALKANFKGFDQFMCEAHTNGMGFRMFVGGSKIKSYQEIHYPTGQRDVIRLVPVIVGSKEDFLQVLIGAVLLTGALLLAPGTGGASLLLLNAVGSLGASLIIGGVAKLLTGPAELPGQTSEDRKTSHLFNGPINTTIQGRAVPVGYGRLIVGSAVVSAGTQDYLTTSGNPQVSISIRSVEYIRIVDLISEGEISGLVDGLKSIYLNETPIQNDDGSYNFQNADYLERKGTNDQTHFYGFSATPTVERQISIGSEIRCTSNSPTGDIVRQITDPDVNFVRVAFLVPYFTSTVPDTGEVRGTEVTVNIYVQPDGGSYSLAISKKLEGTSTSRFRFDLSAELTGSAPWNVKVTKTTADSTSQFVQNGIYLDSITEVIQAKLRYPNSALVAISVGAQQFNSVPSRYYDVKLLKIKIPSNYNPTTRVYTGSWDGTFQTAWSDNPAWVFYDLCTVERYGLGSFVPETSMDKYSLYTIAQYCDEMIDDGLGGTEPRFTCNLLLQDRADAYTVLQNLASIFRGMIYWSAGAVTVSQDSPQDATYLFTPGNVIDGKFIYQGASSKVRHTVALVTWSNPEDFYRPAAEYVEDQDGIARYGIQTVEVVAIGCTSRGQANRFGRWLLYTEQNESETVTFKTGLEGMVGRPGQVIKVADPSRAGIRMGGRISSATTTVVTVDQIVAGSVVGFTLSVMLPTGLVEDRTVLSYVGNAITVSTAFSSAPQSQSIWMLRSDAVEPQTYRVIGVVEESGGVYVLTAIKHDPDKFDAIESGQLLEAQNYSLLRSQPDAPQNIIVTEALYQTGSEVKAKATVSWDRVDRASSYQLRWKRENDNFVDLAESSFTNQDVFDAIPGVYTFQVRAINSLGFSSVVSEAQQELYGKTLPPADVENFTMFPVAGQAYLSWDKATDLDVIIGGQVRLRHSPNIVSQDWNNAIDIIPAVPGSATSAVAPLVYGTYMSKFVDSTGHFSDSATMIITTIPYAAALNVVNTQAENPAYSGVKTNMVRDSGTTYLLLDSDTLIDDYPAIDTLSTWDFPNGVQVSGSYDFTSIFDLGGVWPARIISRVDIQAFDLGNVIDNRTDLIDTWQDLEGTVIDDVNAALYVRTTEDDPTGSPTWTDWKFIASGEYLARAFQFQLRATSESLFHNLYVKALQVTIDMADRAVNLGPITSGTGATYRVDYTEPFYASPAVMITANNMGTGDFYTITSASATGFDIVFKNAASTIVSRIFSLIAKGYGRKTA